MASVLVPLAEGFEELEAVSIIDILRRGEVEVVSAGLREGPVRGARGTVILPDSTLDAVMERDFDLIALPGGQPGTRNLHADPRVKMLLARFRDQGRFTAAICAAPSIFADYGLLAGKRATSFPGSIDPQRGDFQYSEESVVVDGNVITSRGPGTAMDFALTLVELLQGPARRTAVEQGLVRPTRS